MASEPPRRRSTVREPAPQALRDDALRDDTSSPAPSFTPPSVPSVEPVVSSPAESDDSDRPRRSGWWSKRVLGKS
jgi:ribonuclease E